MIWVSIAIELVGGLALLGGFTTRWVAGILALWCLATAFAVHLGVGMHAADPTVALDNMIHFHKNLSVAGGLIYVVAFGVGRFSHRQPLWIL
jgi:putative oxidoreductase